MASMVDVGRGSRRRSRLVAIAIGVLPIVVLFVALTDAQPAAGTPRIGFLTWDTCPGPDSVFAAGLRDVGYVWNQTVHVLCRSADGDYGRLAEAATALVGQKVDAIAALTHITAYAARRATSSIPIVMIASGDPVGTGLVGSLSRPGGNVTGLTYYATELVEKRLQLLKEMVPGVTRIAVLANPGSAHVFGVYTQDAARAARVLGLQLVRIEASQPRELDSVIAAAVKGGAQGLLVLTDPMLGAQARHIAELAAHHRLPAMYWGRRFVEVGGLAAYSADFDAMVRRSTYYLDRILKGARPSELPVEQPTRFALIINLKAAAALGLMLPPSMLARADEVIE
jgi:putative tryptophan/tyrosine transport system substrate-binding protein